MLSGSCLQLQMAVCSTDAAAARVGSLPATSTAAPPLLPFCTASLPAGGGPRAV